MWLTWSSLISGDFRFTNNIWSWIKFISVFHVPDNATMASAVSVATTSILSSKISCNKCYVSFISSIFWKINCYIYNGGPCWMVVQTWNDCIARWGCFLRISFWQFPLSSALMVLWFGGGWVWLIFSDGSLMNSELTKRDHATTMKTTFDVFSSHGGMPCSFEQSWKCPFIKFV